MRLRADQLQQHLNQALLPVYLITGDEPLLIQENCDLIRQACRQQGFTEREVYHADASFDWSMLLDSVNALSLFAERKIIELRLPTGKVNDAGRKALQAYTEHTNSDTVLLISGPKLDASTLKTVWFKAVEKTGATLQVWPMEHYQLPKWINQRLRQHGLKADQDAVQLIAERVEGNLLAAQQEIEKLALLIPDQHITSDAVLAAVADSSRYSVFNLVDRCLQGNAANALKVLHGLRGEGTEALVVLWAVLREIRRLLAVQQQIGQGQAPDRALQSNGVRPPQQRNYQSAIKRLPTRLLYQLLEVAEHADQAAKGLRRETPWLHLETLVMSLCGHTTLLDNQNL